MKILSISTSACWVILAVILLRVFLNKAPKWINYILWGIVGIKLICPFTIESSLSIQPSREPISTDLLVSTPYVQTGVQAIDNMANEYLYSANTGGLNITPVAKVDSLINIAAVVWLIGAIVLLVYTFISYYRVHKHTLGSEVLRDNIRSSENIQSPFILGVLRPVIYVPSGMSDSTLDYVIQHENSHLSRKDHIWKLVGYLLLAVYWFNPLVWISYILFCKDIELACDERVISNMDRESKSEYMQTLLDLSAPRKLIDACPIAFGEVGVKERIKAVINYKKPAGWVIAIAVILCVAVVIGFLTVPSGYGSLKTHAREVGIGEPIDMNRDLTLVDCIEYSNIFTLLEYYSVVREHRYSKCEIDGTLNYDRYIEYYYVDNGSDVNGLNIDQKYLKDKESPCEHNELRYQMTEWHANLLNLDIGEDLAQYPKKLEQTKEKGYIKVVFDIGPCVISDVDLNTLPLQVINVNDMTPEKIEEINKANEEEMAKHFTYDKGYHEIREYYLDPESGLSVKNRSYEYRDEKLVRCGGSDLLYIVK